MTFAIFRTEGSCPLEQNIKNIISYRFHFLVLKFSQVCCFDQMICENLVKDMKDI